MQSTMAATVSYDSHALDMAKFFASNCCHSCSILGVAVRKPKTQSMQCMCSVTSALSWLFVLRELSEKSAVEYFEAIYCIVSKPTVESCKTCKHYLCLKPAILPLCYHMHR